MNKILTPLFKVGCLGASNPYTLIRLVSALTWGWSLVFRFFLGQRLNRIGWLGIAMILAAMVLLKLA